MRETLIFMLVALMSEAFVPNLVEYMSQRREARKTVAEEPADQKEQSDEEESGAGESEETDEGAIERLEAENRLLKEIVGEKVLILRGAEIE